MIGLLFTVSGGCKYLRAWDENGLQIWDSALHNVSFYPHKCDLNVRNDVIFALGNNRVRNVSETNRSIDPCQKFQDRKNIVDI